eukprot:1199603-Pyramimonas_sp.AAC.1
MCIRDRSCPAHSTGAVKFRARQRQTARALGQAGRRQCELFAPTHTDAFSSAVRCTHASGER